MSNLPGNHYMQQLVECTMPKTPESLATLALAYEQRTANLIALADLTMHGGLNPDYDMETIYNRLGLGGHQVNQPPLNPDALDNLATVVFGFDIEEWNEHDEDEKRQLLAPYVRTIETYLAAALPEVTSVPGVYDLGSPEPAGVDQVVECDEHGHPYIRHWAEDEDYTWSKTTDGTRWKGYKDGKEYRTWADLVRRYGPLTEYRPEVKP